MFILILLLRFGFKKLVFHRSIGFQKIYLLLVAQLAPLIFAVQFTIKPKFDQEFGHFVRVLVTIDSRKLPIFLSWVKELVLNYFWILIMKTSKSTTTFANVHAIANQNIEESMQLEVKS